MSKIPKYKRRINGKKTSVKAHSRKDRPKGKKRIISKKPVRLYLIQDEFGQILGYSNKPGK